MMASLSAEWHLTANGRRCLFLILTDVVSSSSNGGFGMRSSQAPRASRRRGPAFNDHLQWMMASLSAEWHLTANGRRCLVLILTDVVSSSSNSGFGMRSSQGPRASRRRGPAFNDHLQWMMASLSAEWHLTANGRRCLFLILTDVVSSSSNGGFGMRSRA